MLVASVLLTAVALVSFKIVSTDARGMLLKMVVDPKLYFGVAIYALAFVMWMVSASRIDYTVLAFSNSLGFVASALIGVYFFNEVMTIEKLVAFLLIISGAILLFASSAKS